MTTMVRMLSLTTAALVCAAPLSAQATLLRMTPTEGQVSRYVIASETSMAGTVMSTSTLYQTETIVSASGDVIETRVAIDSTAMTEAMPGTGGPDLSGASFTFGGDTRARATGLTDAGTLTPESEAAVTAMLGGSFFELPEREVSPGDAWSGMTTTELPAGMGGSMEMTTDITYTLVGLEGDLAEISIEGTVTMSGSAGGMSIEGSGTVSGTAVFDTGNSRLPSQDSLLSLDLTMGGMPASMTISATRELIP